MEIVRAERDNLLALCKQLSPEEWSAPSDCAGWTVQDVIAHLASIAHGGLVPWQLAKGKTGDEINEKMVAARRGRSSAEILREFELWTGRFVKAVGFLQLPVLRDIPVPLPGIGRYPIGMLANSTVFDVYLHMRYDILTPVGPVDRRVPEPPAGAVETILEWIRLGLPQMCREKLLWLKDPVVLELTGPEGAVWRVQPRPGRIAEVIRDDSAMAPARITTRADDFIVWSTRRRDWREFTVKLEGEIAERFCDSVHIV
ncbi:maleylpyruvate isomerase family mycothiol-dependent enzyme [Nocardia arthritidis]|nr:maleylpyruvate isomerase family mycothiol-dependent enzyme [Nocardia arthritidis]